MLSWLALHWRIVWSWYTGPVFSYKLRYIVGFWLVEMAISTNQKPTIYRNLVEMAISTNQKPTIYRNLYENTGTDNLYS